MVKAIDFVVRDSAGGVVRGSVAGDGSNFVQLGVGEEISLNLSQASVAGYVHRGSDLVITLIDGREVVLSGYFNQTGEPNQLYLSQNGEVIGVEFSEAGNGHLMASYGPTDGWDKFSTLDDLRFGNGDDIALAQGATDEPAGMAAFVPGLLGLGGGAAALAGLGIVGAIIGGGGGGGGGGGNNDTTPPDVKFTTGTVNSDGHLENLADYQNGVSVGGTGEAGATIKVVVTDPTDSTKTYTQTTTVGADGKWTVTFPTSQLPPGEYTTPISVTATDATGNYTTVNDKLAVDTIPNAIVVNDVTTDNVVNGTEAASGTAISGTSVAGATLTVKIGEVSQTVTVGSDGKWSIDYSKFGLAAGEYDATITASSTDAAGNPNTVTHTFRVDTTTSVAFSETAIGGDGTINATESASGVTMTGTTQIGNTVSVVWQGQTIAATVDAAGNWSVTFPAGTAAAGTYDATATVTATDAAGNTASATKVVHIDTEVVPLTQTGVVAGDGVVSSAEAAAGVAINGTVEKGSTVVLTLSNGKSVTAVVDANGGWTANLTASDLTAGKMTYTVTATDKAGNVRTIGGDGSLGFTVDGDTWVSIDSTQATDNIVSGAERSAGITLTGKAEAGDTVKVTFEGVTRTVTADASGNWSASYYPGEYKAGTYSSTVSVEATDAAGNTASATHTLKVDTEVVPLTGSTSSAGADGVLNAAEAANGVVVSGTVEAGARSVTVQFGSGSAITANVNADGTWTAYVPASQVPAGTSTVSMTITAVDAVGNTGSITQNVKIDTEVNPLNQSGSVGGDGVVSAAEAAAGVSITGAVEAGSTVVVTLSNGRTVNATVNGTTWTANLSASDLTDGAMTYTVTATDPAGNTKTITNSNGTEPGGTPLGFTVDTNTWVSIDAKQAVDNTVSGSERSAGITLTGKAEAGDTVTVVFGGTTKTVTADASGNWSAAYSSGEYPAGTYDATVSVTAKDAAGNTASATHTVHVDTEVVPLTGSTTSAGADNVLNASEAANGVVVTGTVEAGSTVTVKFGDGTAVTATVTGNTWTATIPASQVPPGESTVTMTINATDSVGNTASITKSVVVDTVVDPLTQTGTVATDGVINAVEAATGVTIGGAVEQGSTVVVTLDNGKTINATVDASGHWSAVLTTDDLDEGAMTYTVSATDKAGNTDIIGDDGSLSLGFTVDTVAPAAPDVSFITRDSSAVTAVFADLDGSVNTFHQVSSSGSVSDLSYTKRDIAGTENDLYQFTNGSVPDGSYLVVESTDAAGNEASTLVIVNNTNTVTVDLNRAGLEQFDFAAIDLTFAPQANLTLTASDLHDLTGPDHSLMIKGGADDMVKLDDATATGTTQIVDGERYAVYSLGDGTVLVDEDIQRSII